MRALKNMKPLSFIAIIMTFSFLGFGQSVPEPEEVLGFKVGADYHLVTYTQPYWTNGKIFRPSSSL